MSRGDFFPVRNRRPLLFVDVDELIGPSTFRADGADGVSIVRRVRREVLTRVWWRRECGRCWRWRPTVLCDFDNLWKSGICFSFCLGGVCRTVVLNSVMFVGITQVCLLFVALPQELSLQLKFMAGYSTVNKTLTLLCSPSSGATMYLPNLFKRPYKSVVGGCD